MYKLTAERRDNGPDIQEVATVGSLVEAAQLVERMEAEYTWPEGFEAVLTDRQTGEKWTYTDHWEKIAR